VAYFSVNLGAFQELGFSLSSRKVRLAKISN
jgi:hypothetical protein